MKKEAVTIRPIASINTARVGYHVMGTGLEMCFADSTLTKKFPKKTKKVNKIILKFS